MALNAVNGRFDKKPMLLANEGIQDLHYAARREMAQVSGLRALIGVTCRIFRS